MNCFAKLPAVVVASVVGAFACTSLGAVVPFTETFANDNANWGGGGNWQNFEPLAWNEGDGPGGANHVTATVDFGQFAEGAADVAFFRGQDNYGSSGGNFVGDWLAGGITDFSFWVRHDAAVELEYFVRFTPAGANFPSMNYRFSDTLVAGETWTKLTLDIDEDNPGWIVGGGPGTYNNVFTNLGKIQIGIDIDPLSAGDAIHNFDLAMVSTIPAPGALALLVLGALGTRRRRA